MKIEEERKTQQVTPADAQGIDDDPLAEISVLEADEMKVGGGFFTFRFKVTDD